MGSSESKLHSRKIERQIIKCPIETTEIIVTDNDSTLGTDIPITKNDDPFRLSSPDTLFSDTLQSTNNISLSKTDLNNFSITNTIWPSNSSLLQIDNDKIDNKPKIKKLNSQIELLNTTFTDNQTDEFETSDDDDDDDDNNSSETDLDSNNISNDDDDEDDNNNNESTETSETNSEPEESSETNFEFNKEFLQTFKDRYTTNNKYNQLKIMENGDQHCNIKDNCDYDDTFTEITKVVSTNNQATNLVITKAKLNRSINSPEHYYNNIINTKLKSPSISNSVSIDSEVDSEHHLHNSLPLSKTDVSSSVIYRRNVHSSLDNNLSNIKLAGFRSLCYKFWVDATYETWKVFHNHRDRRIESIGRLSNCQIRLTKITQRSSKGMLKRQVFVYATTLADLVKCCKLFDDKFPQFCASSNLKIENCIDNRK